MSADKDRNQDFCLKMFEMLSDYIDGDIDLETRKSISEHAEKCIKCRICMETLKRTVEVTRYAEELPVPEDFSKRLGYFFSEIVKQDKIPQ